ncbi:MAG TPA: trigger factor [Lachnospiraceae bacterium]|nr:trigger factor [Lachnospiraceae bacterium]
MKFRKVSAVLIGTMVLSALAGCGKSDEASLKDKQNKYAQYVTLGEYKGVEYTPSNTEVTDEDIQSEIDRLIEDNTIENKDYKKVATMGDAVNIDYVGSVDGKEFDGGSTQGAGTEITLGSSGYIDNFDEQIVGHKPGDSFDVNVTFPKEYGNEELNGKAAVFATTLNYVVASPTVPKYDDVLVASATDYKTTKEFEQAKREELEKENAETDLEADKSTLIGKVIDASQVSELPEQEVNDRIDSLISNVTESAESNGIDLATYLSYYGMDEEGFKTQVKTSVETYIREKMIILTIAEKEGISAEDDEVEAKKQELLDQTGMTDIEQLKQAYGYNDEDFSYEIVYKKVVDLVYNNAKQVEATETDAADDSAKTTEMVDDYGTTEEK